MNGPERRPGVHTEAKDFDYTEPLHGGATTYRFKFCAPAHEIATGQGTGPTAGGYPLTIQVEADASHQVREPDDTDNGFAYTVNFTD